MAKRRNVLIGIGTIAVGSGFTLASAFETSVEPSADFRVIAMADVVVRAGDGVPESGADGNIINLANPGDEDGSRVSDNNLDFGALESEDLPVAGVNDQENGDLLIEVATGIRPGESTPVVFEDLIEIANLGDTDITDIGIAYPRDGTTFGEGAYGSDVVDNPGGSDIGPGTVQEIYQFWAQEDGVDDIGSPLRISPDPVNGGGVEHDTSDDDPANRFTLSFDEVAQVDLQVHTHSQSSPDIVGRLQSTASTTGNPWDGDADVLDLLDSIEVGEGTD